MEQYALGPILGALDRTIRMLWEILSRACDVEELSPDLDFAPSFGLPLVDYA